MQGQDSAKGSAQRLAGLWVVGAQMPCLTGRPPLRLAPHIKSSRNLPVHLAAIADLPATALREQWIQKTGRVVPKVSPSMLRLALAWEIQAMARGGLSLVTRQRVEQLARVKTVTQGTQPGMRLVREWKGKLHIVVVGKDKIIRWDGREWSSLSQVARAITGTRWSGPAFFGLKQKRGAA